VAALGLGLSPVFWSQATIAEVYTLNTFFFLTLVYLGLRACPPGGEPVPQRARLLAAMALLFGLSLSNHYPLMLLVAPAFLVLLWPARNELIKRFGLLSWLVILGLLPYVWMVRRSWMDPPISFDGPLETIQEIWYFVSRAGYANVDDSASAGWLDRVRFFGFLGGEILLQFALVGALLAAAGVIAQRRVWGDRIALFLGIAFLMPSAVLILLLGFDYDSVSKHVFHVYPLPAYAVLALWMGLGFARLVERYAPSPGQARAAAAGLLLAIALVGARTNLLGDQGWGARFAEAVLRSLPKDAAVFTGGESNLGPLAYFYLIEGARPDIELYQWRGLVLGNRLFHPLRASEEDKTRRLKEFVERHEAPTNYLGIFLAGYGGRDRWLYFEIDKVLADPPKVAIDIPEELVAFLEADVLAGESSSAWTGYQQDELRRHYAVLLGQRIQRGQQLDARDKRHLALLSQDFFGLLGLAEGLMKDGQSYPSGAVIDALDRAKDLMPSDLPKTHRARFLYLRGILRLDLRDKAGGLRDLEAAFATWPVANNPAVSPLRDLYRAAGDRGALQGLEAQVQRTKER
jgi:hypothetical protein